MTADAAKDAVPGSAHGANRRYVIIGAGAIGATIGGRLLQVGHSVVLVARGAHLAALQNDGLQLVTPDGAHRLPVVAVGDPQQVRLTPDDVLILAVKSQDTAQAIEAWVDTPVGADATARSLPLLCAQNGVANERMAARYFDRVYGICVWLPATFRRPGTVVAEGAPYCGLLDVGCFPSGTDAVSNSTADALAASGFAATSTPNVMRWKYGKLLENLSNALDALCGQSDELRELSDLLIAEGAAALEAAGIEYATSGERRAHRDHLVQPVPIPGYERSGSSSWQSLDRGTGTIEIDYLNGEIALLSREHGTAAPANIAVQHLARAAARQRRPPGSFPIHDLLRAVEQAADRSRWLG